MLGPLRGCHAGSRKLPLLRVSILVQARRHSRITLRILVDLPGAAPGSTTPILYLRLASYPGEPGIYDYRVIIVKIKLYRN